MPQYRGFGTATHVSATGLQTISSCSGGVALIGVMANASATAIELEIYHGVTASALAVGTVIFASGSVASYIDIPAHISGGMTIDLNPTQDPDVTLFWNPV